MKWLVILPDGYDYTQVYSKNDFEKSFGHLHPDYQPRIHSEHTNKADALIESQECNNVARNKYSNY